MYADNKDDILKVAEEYKDYYTAISGQTITNHELLTNDVRCTTFSNGVKVYTNYTDKSITAPSGKTVEACGYVWEKN